MEFKYRGLRARLEHVDVTDEEVTRQLVRLQQQSQRRTPVFDRPSQNGDELVLDYAGFADGQQFAGGTAEKQTLVLGSGTFIPGFEEQLVGKNPGDDVTVHVTFPAQYHAPELAGKDAEFRCHIHEIRTVAPYALDDTFAKEVGECETMDEMRQKMRTSLEDYYAERAEMELRERLLHQAAATMDFTPDPAEISKAVEEQLDTMSAQLAQKNLTLEDYCKFTNSTLDQMREDARPGAEQAVRIKALVRKVTALLAFPMGLGLWALSDPLFRLFYRSYNAELGGSLLAVLGIASIFVCLMLITNSILQAYGRVSVPIVTMLVGGGVKIVLNYNLVALPSVNIHGAPIGTLVCFALTALLNLIAVARIAPFRLNYPGYFLRPLFASLVMAFAARGVYALAAHFLIPSVEEVSRLTLLLCVGIAIGVAVVIYGVLVLALHCIRRSDLELLPKGDKLARLLHIS